MQQFGASAFYTVVHWHKLHKVNSEYTLHISIILAICAQKNCQIWWRFDEVLTKTRWVIFWHTLYMCCVNRNYRQLLAVCLPDVILFHTLHVSIACEHKHR